jgi:transposase
MWRIELNDEERQRLGELRRERALKPAERDRVEMVALSDQGWRVGQIATHLGYSAETVRRVFRRWPEERWGVVRHQLPGPAPDGARREQVLGATRRLLAQPRTWTAAQVAEGLAEQGIVLSTRQLRRYLRQLGAGWRRTQRSLRHKQNPERVAQAKETLGHLANRQKQAS